MTTTEEILNGLNDDQKAAVLDFEGSCRILAGPGAGKTATVVRRTQYMIHKGIDASSIMLFTFTNKAAREIKERIAKAIGDDARKLTVGTYHSVCVRILKQYADYIGFSKNFTIFDTEDSNRILQSLTKGLNFDNRKAAEYISSCKDKMILPSIAMQNAQSELEQQLADVYQSYQNELKAQDAMDFDDLISNTIHLFERNQEVLDIINNKYRYITADEFHDSSARDIRFIELLAGETKNVCMILDDEQSIYSFRGADISSVLKIDKIFSDLKTFVLQRNYRSTQTIVKASRSLIAKNKHQLEKNIFSKNETGTPLVFFTENNQSDESLRVLKLIMLLTRKYELQYKDIAILYRMSYLSRALEDKLITGNIPYRIIAGTPFYARKEIKDILCYARLVYNPYDFEALRRAINEPKKGVGDSSVEKIIEYARTTYDNPIDAITACKEIKLKGKPAKGLEQFNVIIEKLQEIAETGSASEFIQCAINDTSYKEYLFKTEETGKAEEKYANLIELIELANTFDTLEELLQNTSLDSQIDEEGNTDDNQVQLLTMHASKGLEYPAVIIVGANDGITPHWRATESKSLEEERRLFYVAMTRAEKYLFMTRPKMVMQQGRLIPSSESRFIKDIDKEYIQKY